jgi:hypothetical protein
LTSKSKIPPQLGGPLAQTLDRVADRVDLFGFHGALLSGYVNMRL